MSTESERIMEAYWRGSCDLLSAAILTLRDDGRHTLADELEHAYMRYQAGEVKEFADAFGPTATITQRQRRAMEQRIRESAIYATIEDLYRETGFTKQDPSKYDNTVFHAAAGVFFRSPSQLFKIYYAERKRRIGG